MRSKTVVSLVASSLMFVLLVGFKFSPPKASKEKPTENDRMITSHAQQMIKEGRRIL